VLPGPAGSGLGRSVAVAGVDGFSGEPLAVYESGAARFFE